MNRLDVVNKVIVEMYGEMNPSLYNSLKTPVKDLTQYQKALLKNSLNVRSKKSLLREIERYLRKPSHHIRAVGDDRGVEGFILFEERNNVITNLSLFVNNGKPAAYVDKTSYLLTFFSQTSYSKAFLIVPIFHPLTDELKEVCDAFKGCYTKDEEFITFSFENIYKFDIERENFK